MAHFPLVYPRDANDRPIRFRELPVGSLSAFVPWVCWKVLSVGQFSIAMFDHRRASCELEGIKNSSIHALIDWNLCNLCSGRIWLHKWFCGLCKCDVHRALRLPISTFTGWTHYWLQPKRQRPYRLLISPTLPKVLVLSTVPALDSLDQISSREETSTKY